MEHSRARNVNFDATKGYLILLVILGHLIIENVVDNSAKQVIYFFHMPLFLAITGYFVRESTLSISISEILIKYWPRMLLPYIVSFFVYTCIDLALRDISVTPERILRAFLYPFYHLWYVPAVLIFIFYTKAIRTSTLLLAIGLIVSLSLCVAHEAVGGPHVDEHSILKYLGDKRFYHYYFYFLVGFCLASFNISEVEIPLLLLPFCLLLFLLGGDEWLVAIAKVAANTALIFITVHLCEKASKIKYRWLVRLGTLSLPIYLWHVLPIAGVKVIYPNAGELYYPIAIGATVLFVVVISLLEGKNKLLDKIVYGH